MKRVFLPNAKRSPREIAVLVALISIAITFVDARVLPVAAGERGSRNVINSLAYPTSSECFIEAGQQRLEQEIQRLQRGSNVRTPDLLEIDPAVFKQQQDWHRLEPRLLDGERVPRNRTSPTGLPED
jgi:hypothetical protein